MRMDRLYDVGTLVITLAIIAAITIGYVAARIGPHDNFIEQSAEEVIYQETGRRFDFSKESR